ncbi:MAG: ABC transporter substrate-binding protein, partial [Burkholderiales bacterium]
MTSTRRSMLTRASVAAAAGTALGFPMIARAQQNFSWKMTSAYGKGSPFYMEGPG